MNVMNVATLIQFLQKLDPETLVTKVTRTGRLETDTMGIGVDVGRITGRELTFTIQMPDIPWREDTRIG